MMMRDLATLEVVLRQWLDDYPNRWEMPVRDAYWVIRSQVDEAMEGAKDEG